MDFYRTVTGVPRVEAVDDPRREGQLMRSVRLERIQEITTCSDCWREPGVQVSLEEARRSGALSRA